MNTDASGAHKRPTEGNRLGGTLAEGRVTTHVNDRPKQPNMTEGSRAYEPLVKKGRVPPTHTDLDQGTEPPGGVTGSSALHFDHRVWLNSLRFYREELFIFQRHLEQYVRTSAVPETMAHVEQYQNKFIRQSEVIDELAHDIKQHDKVLATQLSEKTTSIVYRPFGIHNELRERMEIFERLYMELKMEFRHWLAYNR